MLVYRFLEKDFVLENVFLTLGRKSFTCGRALAKISRYWVYEISWQGISLQKQPFILASRHLVCFARRNLWDSATEIPYC